MQDELFIVSDSKHPLTKQQPLTADKLQRQAGLRVKKALEHVII